MNDSDLSKTEPEGSGSNLIYHYTDQKGLLGIIEDRSLWATHFHHLNDESEWKIGSDLYRTCTKEILRDETEIRRRFPCMSAKLLGSELRDALAQLLDGIAETTAKQDVFLTCFSAARPHVLEIGRTAEDDLNQWRAYAGGSGGVAIGFDRTELVNTLKPLAQKQ